MDLRLTQFSRRCNCSAIAAVLMGSFCAIAQPPDAATYQTPRTIDVSASAEL
ncbi:hypothetical protein [Dyella amyloliquefaciens]|uniref:hypothetical protein n=1 Tax=Dyella amyloliquefaciens TaxID=1770545 RepID=UPI0013EE6CFC|nr:hypothetical protein [Dyella amyloliquefaciens]